MNSKAAYKMLQDATTNRTLVDSDLQPSLTAPPPVDTNNNADSCLEEESKENIGTWDVDEAESERINQAFDQLRHKVRGTGLLDGKTSFFIRKFFEAVFIISLALYLQRQSYYCLSALCMGLAWQQLGCT